MAKFGNSSIYTGTSDDLQRERRMSEWQRAMMLPTAAQTQAVQDRMIRTPTTAPLPVEWSYSTSTSVRPLCHCVPSETLP